MWVKIFGPESKWNDDEGGIEMQLLKTGYTRILLAFQID